jgi:DNA invertase Pin-like site-specific DNA recombinase
VKKAGAELEDARRELHRAVREAHAGGHSYAAIARVLGISRQRVAEIVRQD